MTKKAFKEAAEDLGYNIHEVSSCKRNDHFGLEITYNRQITENTFTPNRTYIIWNVSMSEIIKNGLLWMAIRMP